MDSKPERVRLLPFLVGAAVGSLFGVVIGALLSAPLGQAIASVAEETVDRLLGHQDEELRFELLLQ